jgi:hypothetical protein
LYLNNFLQHFPRLSKYISDEGRGGDLRFSAQHPTDMAGDGGEQKAVDVSRIGSSLTVVESVAIVDLFVLAGGCCR